MSVLVVPFEGFFVVFSSFAELDPLADHPLQFLGGAHLAGVVIIGIVIVVSRSLMCISEPAVVGSGGILCLSRRACVDLQTVHQ